MSQRVNLTWLSWPQAMIPSNSAQSISRDRRSTFFWRKLRKWARQKQLRIKDLKEVPWIRFAHRVHPVLYEAIIECAMKSGIDPPERHHVSSAEHAAQLVKNTGGVAFLTKRGAWRVAVDGLTIRPLNEAGIRGEDRTCGSKLTLDGLWVSLCGPLFGRFSKYRNPSKEIYRWLFSPAMDCSPWWEVRGNRPLANFEIKVTFMSACRALE